MDTQTGQLLSILAMVISAGGIMIGVINHKRIRSSCCGKKAEASLDIENTTPPIIKKSISASGSETS